MILSQFLSLFFSSRWCLLLYSSMIDMKISAVLNPKSKNLAGGEAIYLCINRKARHYIHLKLDKIPKHASSGKPLKWVNSQDPIIHSWIYSFLYFEE